MTAILDTTVLVADAFRDYPEVTAFAATSISYAELRRGLTTAPTRNEHAVRSVRLRKIEERFGPGTPFDDQAAFSYDILTDLLLERGRTSPDSRQR